ncbi:MAG: TonB-dependent receptor, partial [Rhodocyclaceae bacterium]
SALLQNEWLRDRSDVVPSVNENYLYTGTGAFVTDLLGLTDPGAKGTDPLKRAAYTGREDGLMYMNKGQRISVDGFYANLQYDTGIGTISSVTGYRFQRSRIPNSYAGATAVGNDGQLLSFFDASRDDNRKTWQQELRFASDLEGPFNFVAGGFYQRDKIDFCVAQLLGFLDLTSGPLPFGESNNTPYILCHAQRSKSRAVFFEGTLKLGEKLTLSAGGRYTWDNKTWLGRQQTFIPALGGGFDPSISIDHALDASVYKYPANVITLTDKWRQPTYRASISYQANDDLYLFGTYSHGYKGGGFNDQIGGFAAFGDDLNAFREAARATSPEKADSFEIGFKSEFLDNRVRLNATAFYVKYSDLQKQLNVPIEVNGQPNQVTLFVNAASADVKGLEIEASATPVEGLTLRGVLGYQDGKYKKYTAANAGYDLASAPLDRAPKWQWTADAVYSLPVSDNLKLTFNGNVAYTGRNLNTQAIDDPLGNTFLNARTLVNGSITLAETENKYYVRLVGKNLTDKRYRVGIQNVAGLWLNSQYGPPRYFGLEVGVSFGSEK